MFEGGYIAPRPDWEIRRGPKIALNAHTRLGCEWAVNPEATLRDPR